MPNNKYRAWANGEVLTAANLTDYIQKNVVVQCDTAADLPDAGTRREGMAAYVLDTDRLLIFSNGAAAGWTPPWNTGWGLVGFAFAGTALGMSASSSTSFPTASIANVAANTSSNIWSGQVTSQTNLAPVTANRRLYISATISASAGNGTRNIGATIFAGTSASPTTVIAAQEVRSTSSTINSVINSINQISVDGIHTTGAALYVRLQLTNTTDTPGAGGAVLPRLAQITITDIGPAGAPT